MPAAAIATRQGPVGLESVERRLAQIPEQMRASQEGLEEHFRESARVRQGVIDTLQQLHQDLEQFPSEQKQVAEAIGSVAKALAELARLP